MHTSNLSACILHVTQRRKAHTKTTKDHWHATKLKSSKFPCQALWPKLVTKTRCRTLSTQLRSSLPAGLARGRVNAAVVDVLHIYDDGAGGDLDPARHQPARTLHVQSGRFGLRRRFHVHVSGGGGGGRGGGYISGRAASRTFGFDGDGAAVGSALVGVMSDGVDTGLAVETRSWSSSAVPFPHEDLKPHE